HEVVVRGTCPVGELRDRRGLAIGTQRVPTMKPRRSKDTYGSVHDVPTLVIGRGMSRGGAHEAPPIGSVDPVPSRVGDLRARRDDPRWAGGTSRETVPPRRRDRMPLSGNVG